MSFLESLRVLWAEYAIWYESLMPSERWPVLHFGFLIEVHHSVQPVKSYRNAPNVPEYYGGRSTPWMALSALVDLFPELTVYRNPKEPKTALFVAPDGLTYQVNPCQVSRIDAIDDINVWRALSKTEIAAGAALELASHAWAEDRIFGC